MKIEILWSIGLTIFEPVDRFDLFVQNCPEQARLQRRQSWWGSSCFSKEEENQAPQIDLVYILMTLLSIVYF